jgi:hypothetical protein
MSALRCTQPLLRRLRLPCRLPDPGLPTAPLGDWTLTVLHLRRGPLIVGVNKASLLPVVFPARRLDLMVATFLSNLEQVLLAIGVPPDTAAAELARMQPLAYGNTNDRSLLGVLNNFIAQVRSDAHHFPDLTTHEIAIRISEAPYGPIAFKNPQEVTRALLACRPPVTLLKGGAA